MTARNERLLKVGADVEALCGKCGDVWHVVVAKVGERVAKVQCKQCNAYHRYRTGGAKAKAKPKRRSAAAERAARKSSRKIAAVKEAGPKIAPDMTRPVRTYSPAENYRPADRINHPTFGFGVVEAATTSGKMTVHFPGGRRQLAQAAAPMRLERPPRRDPVEPR